jgi:alpha-1,2-mannosyltransferase
MWTKRLPAVILIVVLLSLVGLFLWKGQKGMVDFEVNDTAGKRIRAGETLYRQEDGHYQFKYPPFAAFLYVPVSFLPLGAAKLAWFLLILASSVLVFNLSYALVRPEAKKAWVLRVFPPLILAKFFLRELQLGQINALITALLLATVTVLIRKEDRPGGAREGWAGILWGASFALKPYALIFLPYWVLKKNFLVLAGGVLMLILAFLGPALYYGPAGNIQVHEEWLDSLSRSTPALLGTQDNVSLIALFTKWTGRSQLARALYLMTLAVLALIFLFLVIRGRIIPRGIVLESALLLTLIPIVSPLGWDYTLLSSVPAVMLVLNNFDVFPRPAGALLILDLAVAGLSVYDLMGQALYAKFMALSIITVNFLVLAAFLAWLRLKGRA